jgi:hypothetical protein
MKGASHDVQVMVYAVMVAAAIVGLSLALWPSGVASQATATSTNTTSGHHASASETGVAVAGTGNNVTVHHHAPPVAQEDRFAGREFLPNHVTFKSIDTLTKGKTGLQADLLLAPYKDKWVRLNGSVKDVRASYQEFLVILIAPHFDNDDTVLCYFQKECKGRLSVLEIGERIEIIGRVAITSRLVKTLKECEFA